MGLSRIARRLSLYFGAVLVVFALTVGAAFYKMFESNMIEMRRQEMTETAQRMAEVVSNNIDIMEFYHGSFLANSRLAAYLDNVAREDVWLIGANREMYISPAVMERMRRRGPAAGRKGDLPPPRNSQEAYNRLPEMFREKIEKAFAGEEFFLQRYSRHKGDTVLTVGVPSADRHGVVKAVLVLHAPVEGIQSGVNDGLKILGFSMLTALGFGIILSWFMAQRFTNPLSKMQGIAEQLGNENYDVRCNIDQNDEIGELADTMDTMADRLESAQDQRRQLDKMRKQFIANITHELRTPLTVVLASLEALKLGVVAEPGEVAQTYESMYKEGMYAKDLISDLLELSKLQNSDFPLDMGDTDLVELIRSVIAGAEKLAQKKKITISFVTDRQEWILHCDNRRIREMLLIFLTNGIKFSDDGKVIGVKLERGVLTITDQGCGMDDEMVEHAFETFVRSKDERNKDGSGLGLAIAKSIADRHGYKLSLTSQVGTGTEVRVVF